MPSRWPSYLVALVLIVAVNFALPRLMPGDPLQAIYGGEMLVEMTPEAYAALERRYGLDRPLAEQFLFYLGRLARGDLGQSYYYGCPVPEVIGGALPWTLLLAGSAFLLSSLLGMWLGIESGWRRDKAGDRGLLWLLGLVNGLPDFFLGILFLLLFGVLLHWFPLFGALTPYAGYTGWALALDAARHLALPLAVLTLTNLTDLFLLTRGSMVTVLGERYVLTARAKGLTDRVVRYRHAGRAALGPVTARLGVRVGRLVTGAVFVEVVFSYPGIGGLLQDALAMRDYPLLQGLFLLITVSVLAANALADYALVRVDPRAGHAY
ncbi:MAG: ABC transporter permease [Bacillota bacterium]|nr:ABC transporter permease [Bacillota bacterium]